MSSAIAQLGSTLAWQAGSFKATLLCANSLITPRSSNALSVGDKHLLYRSCIARCLQTQTDGWEPANREYVRRIPSSNFTTHVSKCSACHWDQTSVVYGLSHLAMLTAQRTPVQALPDLQVPQPRSTVVYL